MIYPYYRYIILHYRSIMVVISLILVDTSIDHGDENLRDRCPGGEDGERRDGTHTEVAKAGGDRLYVGFFMMFFMLGFYVSKKPGPDAD